MPQSTPRAQHASSQPAFDEVRQEFNRLVADVNYYILNGLSGNALPAVAVGLSGTQVKTVNSVNYFSNGKPVTKGATDNLWTLAGTLVAVSSWQKYLLLLDGAGTATVAEGVQSAVSAAAVTYRALPAVGVAIIAIATVQTDATHTFNPGVTALAAAGITTTFQDGFDPQAILSNPITLQ